MKMTVLLTGIILVSAISCTKPIVYITANVKNPPTQYPGFTKYTIAKSAQYCDKNAYTAVSYQQQKFTVIFDSSAIYTSKIPGNQLDINKLFGFSDNNKQHHQYSARIGWRWSNNALRLFGYIYNNGVVSSKELSTIAIGSQVNCAIAVSGNQYVFAVNGKLTNMNRESTTTKGSGYKLYPYFGGDEFAPHEVRIWIKEL